jgi:Uma2 family endonuclease
MGRILNRTSTNATARRTFIGGGRLSSARVTRFQGAVNMSVTEVLAHLPTHWLDGVPPDKRVVIGDVSWDYYESLVEQLGESRNRRVAFDGKDIEMMTLGPFHERQKSLLDWFIMIVAGELKIERQPMGSTTWKRKKLKRAIESDLCYYFDPAKLAAVAAAAESDNIDIYPNPDLAAEVDVSPPKIDRPGIYAALQVLEFWRVRNKAVPIEQLGPDGTYVPVPRSRFLPVRAEDVTRWIFSEDSSSLVEWEARLRQWVRDQLVPEAGE